MIYMTTKFKIVDRGFNEIMVLAPGWATDYRIFDSLDLSYNYLLPMDFSPFDFKQSLSKFLDVNSIDRVSLFGWSIGGFLVSEFAAENTEKVDELILLSIRKRYDRKVLEEIMLKIEKNRRAFLYKFYLDCFSGHDNQGICWFKGHLLKKYLDKMSVEYLLEGLDYLSNVRVETKALSGLKKIRIFHGAKDKIAPLEEAREIKGSLPTAEFISLENSGHALFLSDDFKERFNG